jgi:hypothetical protein
MDDTVADNPQRLIDWIKRWATLQRLPVPTEVEVSPQEIVVVFAGKEDAMAWVWWFGTEILTPEGNVDHADREPSTGLPGLRILHRPNGPQ